MAFSTLTGCTAAPQKAESKKSETRLQLGYEYINKQEFEGARTECKAALELDPTNEGALYCLGLVQYLEAGRLQLVLERHDCLSGAEAEGLRAEFDEHLVAADTLFGRAAEIAPDYGDAYAMRAAVKMHFNDFESAVELYRLALKHPARLRNGPVIRAQLGWAYFQQDNFPLAAAELRKSVSFQPGLCLGHFRLGRVYFAREEWENARQQFERVVSESCPIQDAYLYLMKTNIELGHGAELSQLQDQCVTLAPRSCIASQCRAL